MLRIQPLKHIQKINVDVKLDDTSETSFRSRCSPQLCLENSVSGAVDEDDFVNDVVEVWSRSRLPRPRPRPRFRLRPSPLALIMTISTCLKFDDSRRILLSKTRWRLFLNFMKRPLPLNTVSLSTANRESMILVISIASTSRSMSMKSSPSADVVMIVGTRITSGLMKRQWEWTWASFRAPSGPYSSIPRISWLADQSEGGCSYSIFEGGVTIVKGGVYATAALQISRQFLNTDLVHNIAKMLNLAVTPHAVASLQDFQYT